MSIRAEGMAGRMRFFLWLAVAACALSPAAALGAGKKQPAIQQICGQDLEVVWEKAIVAEPDKDSRVFFKVYPAGKNYWAEIEWWPKKPGSDEKPLALRNVLLDPKGDKIWQRDMSQGYLDIPYAIAGTQVVMVGDKLYKYDDRILSPFEKGLRYHVWLDADGYILAVHAHRVGNIVALGALEAGDGVVYNIDPWCTTERSCLVDRLTVTEKGIDPKGWQTLVRWPYPAGCGEETVYGAIMTGSSHLLVYKKEPKTTETEWRLITFSPSGDGRIISESKYLLPAHSSPVFIKNKKGDFVFFDFQDGGGYTFMRLDESGRVVEKKEYRLPETFATFIQMIRQFRDGWIIEGLSDLLRISSDGSPLWLHRLPGYTSHVFVGNGEDTLFFGVRNKLYMCREKTALKE